MLRFWQWLRKFAQRKARNEFLISTHVNLRCPSCKVWWSDAEPTSRLVAIEHPIAVEYHCGQCDGISHWVCEAGFWLTYENFTGQPFKQSPAQSSAD